MTSNSNDGWGNSWPTSPSLTEWPTGTKSIKPEEFQGFQPDNISFPPIHTTLKMYNGELVEAIVVGDLAIWETEEEGGWSICHVPTLTDIMSCVPYAEDGVYSNDELIRWCQTVQSSLTEDWLALKQLTRENYAQKPDLIEVKQRVRNLCSNTPLNEWKE